VGNEDDMTEGFISCASRRKLQVGKENIRIARYKAFDLIGHGGGGWGNTASH
jgi:hypothetical protein